MALFERRIAVVSSTRRVLLILIMRRVRAREIFLQAKARYAYESFRIGRSAIGMVLSVNPSQL